MNRRLFLKHGVGAGFAAAAGFMLPLGPGFDCETAFALPGRTLSTMQYFVRTQRIKYDALKRMFPDLRGQPVKIEGISRPVLLDADMPIHVVRA